MTALTLSRSCTRSSRPLQVRFCPQPSVMYTYSQSDYDRSGLFPENSSEISIIKPILFTVSVNFLAPKSHSTATPRTIRKKKISRPKLTIDTSSLHGPLYFTSMTTNHEKKERLMDIEETDILDKDEDEEWILKTRENTRRNSLLAV
ncbi:hypothetical protein J3Q64DRAFT_1770458 [Phycomyces blakesleeanus]|uniref:Uncharacterized protein n=2 Tax=Phycomyces blakesleeanus TaxID=4837 RepID=A0A162TN54_PHYB8|nr:hypothetical protein PHYBLDRAFT_171830 [Phycomyces blakesleeanus NRRL 1555(-)]OAD69812.1 hypothetical protein PHYBLDRAFT_171830 [Phycomyces blakesleeanus NRRL 1555(-)]|eukprot:XP_018287852.1 hypothetical protein PHYBLDRAFT_171830 [Phycomyces blakesleeanus NRRL 1555(-)]